MSITGLGNSYKDQALAGLRNVAGMESQRETANEQMEQAKKQSVISTTVTGAGMGAMAGMKMGAVGGPMGALIGGAAGFLFSSLFS